MTRRGIAIVLLLSLAYAGGLAALVAQTPARPDAPSPFPSGSSFARSDGGAALAAAYLRGRGHKVLPLMSASVANVAAGSVIFVIDPPHFPNAAAAGQPLLTLEEERFVRQGGRIVLALRASVPSLDVKAASAPSAWVRVHPDWPGVARLDPGGASFFLSGPWLRDAYTVFSASDEPVLARKRIGGGDVVAIASSALLENSHLGLASNLELLDALAAGRESVYFDESTHGLGASEGMGDLLHRWKLTPFLLSLFALAIATLVHRNHGLGRPDRDEAGRPEDAVDLVDALGRLYARSLRDEEALGLHRDHLRHVVSERSGLRGQALRNRVDRLLANPVPKSGSKEPAFEQQLGAINRALRRAHEQPR